MKKTFLLLSIVAMIAGCSDQAANGNDSTKANSDKNETKQVVDEKEVTTNEKQIKDEPNEYVPNPQLTDDRTLQEVGQSHMDDKGVSTLKAIKKGNKTYKIGDIELTIHDIKVIDHTPAYSMIDFFHSLTHEEEFDFIKVNVEIKNTSKETVNFAPVARLETSTGEQKYFEQDIYLENLNGEIEGNGEKQGNLGYILEEPLKEDLKWVKITTSDILDQNHKVINKAQEIKVEF